MSGDEFILGDSNGLCMPVAFAVLDKVDTCFGNTVCSTNGGTGLFICKTHTNIGYIGKGQSTSATSNRNISVIFGLRSSVKMPRIYATRIIAMFATFTNEKLFPFSHNVPHIGFMI